LQITSEQRAEWLRKTADDPFNRWLNPQVRDASGALDLDKLYDVAARYIDVNRLQYSHLNAGQQRMAVGNRLRKVVPASQLQPYY
jgi:hypothetical protein